MLKLTREDDAEHACSVFSGSLIRIGRIGVNDLVLPVAHISSRHAQINVRNGKYYLADLGSTNGSLVVRSGQRLLLGEKGAPEVALETGDLLLLGDIECPIRLRVEIVADERESVGGNTIVALRSRPQTAEVNRRVTGDHQALAAIFRLVEQVNVASDRGQILALVADAALAAIPGAADVLVVVRDGSSPPQLAVRAQAHRGAGLSRRPNDKICARVLDRGEALLFGDQRRVELPATLAASGVGSGIACPIFRAAGEVVGVLQINCRPDLGLGEAQLDLGVVLAHHAGTALERAELIGRLQAAEARLRDENAYLRRQTQPSVDLIATSPAMVKVVEELRRAASSDVTVLLTGETGTGKEIAARFLHHHSRRCGALLVPVNCGALSETLLDSELFGHKRGAFTGAAAEHKGVFEVAGGGTVFLDEVGETPASVQVRLLRVLEEGKIKRVGDSLERSVDVRIIAATNRDLAALVEAGRFRRDLYYRLRVFPIPLPPLRERAEDIAPLCHAIVARHAERSGKQLGPIDDSLIDALRSYPFPGNVRELVNELERAIVRVDEGEPLTAELLSEEVLQSAPRSPSTHQTLRQQLDDLERDIIARCLARHDRKAAAAAELGLTRQGLNKKIARLGIRGQDPP